MFYLKHGSSLFFRNIVLSIILALQIAISIFLAGMTLSKVENMNKNISIFYEIKNIDGLYVMPAVELAAADMDIDGYVQKLDGIKDAVKIHQNFSQISNENVRMMYYDDFIIENCKLPLSKGNWFTEIDYANYVPVIINREQRNLKLGDSFQIEETTYKIIGVLGQREQYITFGNGGNNEDITTLIANYDGIETMFICPSNCFNQEYLNECMQDTNFLVIFNNINDYDKSIVVQKLNDIGFTKSISNLYIDGKANMKNQLINLSPYIILSFLLSLIGVASSVTLMMFKELKKFSVFYICGIQWKNIQRMIPIYIIYLFLFSIAFYLVIYACCINMGILFYYEVLLTYKEIFVLTIIFVIIFIVSMLPINIIFKKTQPIDILYQRTNN